MRAGKLNTRVRILRPEAEDELGQQGIGWVEFGKAWANVRTMRGMEMLKAGAMQPRVSASVRMRYREDITSSMRIVDGATVYDVKAVLPDTVGRRHVDLVCEVVT
jgi:SPP1 family predicted phage head-tail adaptor